MKGKGPRAATSSLTSPFPAFFPQTISITPMVYALRHLKLVQEVLPPPTESEARDISDQDLADLLRKPSLGLHDRANHETICGQLRDMYIDDNIGIEMYYNDTRTTVWLDLRGNVMIPPEKMDDITYKYHIYATRKGPSIAW